MLGGHTRIQEKEVVTPQETELDLPVTVEESPVQVWVNSGLPVESGTLTTPVLGVTPCWHKSFWRRSPLPLP